MEHNELLQELAMYQALEDIRTDYLASQIASGKTYETAIAELQDYMP